MRSQGIWKTQYERSLKRQHTRYMLSCREKGKQVLFLGLQEGATLLTLHGNSMAYPPSNALLHADGCSWPLHLAAAEACRNLPAPQLLQIQQGVPMIKLWSFFALLKKISKLHKEKHFTLIWLQNSSISMLSNASLRLPLLPESHHLKNSDKSPI